MLPDPNMLALVALAITVVPTRTVAAPSSDTAVVASSVVELPPPSLPADASLADVLARRRSQRDFAPRALTSTELSTLLWAAQGITGAGGLRTAPSAGAIHPLVVYVLTANGAHRYDPFTNRLDPVRTNDVRDELSHVAFGQSAIRDAPAVFVLVADVARTASRYGNQATHFVDLEAGHVAQNILLTATALGLASVPIGAFDPPHAQRIVGLRSNETPIYLVAVGGRRTAAR